MGKIGERREDSTADIYASCLRNQVLPQLGELRLVECDVAHRAAARGARRRYLHLADRSGLGRGEEQFGVGVAARRPPPPPPLRSRLVVGLPVIARSMGHGLPPGCQAGKGWSGRPRRGGGALYPRRAWRARARPARLAIKGSPPGLSRSDASAATRAQRRERSDARTSTRDADVRRRLLPSLRPSAGHRATSVRCCAARKPGRMPTRSVTPVLNALRGLEDEIAALRERVVRIERQLADEDG
jgi:hypothetical protein